MASNISPAPRQSLSLWQSVASFLQANYVFSLTAFRLWAYRKSTKAFWAARSPTRIFSLPARPNLEIRLFQPYGTSDAPKDSGEAPGKAPIFFLIHGGGWNYGNPAMDDEQAHLLSTKYGFCVMSLEYSMGPRNRFPKAIHELAYLINALLDDKELIEKYDLDTNKVVLGGFSAGGTMTLSLAQLPNVRDRVHALVSFYPLTDFTGEYLTNVGTTAWGKKIPDVSAKRAHDYVYVPAGHDMRDPLLSPLYATRDQIPQPLFMITAEKDPLFKEGSACARRLAGLESNENTDVVEAWEQNGVRYECAREMCHCFPHFWEYIGASAEWEKNRKETTERIWREMAEWTKSVM